MAQSFILRGFPRSALDFHSRVVLRRAGALDLSTAGCHVAGILNETRREFKNSDISDDFKAPAADCSINNERSRKVTLEGMSKMDELAKKHGVNLVGARSVHSEHLQVLVFEAASFEALQAFSDEPVITNMTNLYTNEVKVAETMQASMQRIIRA